MSKGAILTAIDIGTDSIKVLVGQKELETSSVINILSKEKMPQFGLRKGEIYDPDKAAKELILLKQKIENNKNIKIKKVIVNINGPNLSVFKSQGIVSVSRADGKISEEDVQRALQASQAINLPFNKEILDILPKEFIVDNQSGIKNPIGLKGIRLEAKTLLICVFSSVLENLEKTIENAGFEIEGIIPSPLACSRAVLNSEQKELGSAVIDIGSATTSLSIFIEGNLINFIVYPFGSANITNDIAIGLRTEISIAERIKKEFGTFEILTNKKKDKKTITDKKIEIPEKELCFSKNFLNQIIKARITELFSEINKDLKKISKDAILPAGIVLTGGGSCLAGLSEFAKQKFNLPCRVSGPQKIAEVEEMDFSTAAGLLLSGFDLVEQETLGKRKKGESGLKSKIKNLFKIFLP